jgi:hypothetical protein
VRWRCRSRIVVMRRDRPVLLRPANNDKRKELDDTPKILIIAKVRCVFEAIVVMLT